MLEYVLTAIVTLAGVMSLLVWFTAYRVTILWRDFQRRVLERSQAPQPNSEPRISQVKRDVITNPTPRTFCYLDKTQVGDLYPSVLQELEPNRIETRERRETRKGILAKLILIRPKYQRTRSEEITKTYNLKQTSAVMYNKVEKYLFEQKDVTFAIEDFDYDESRIDEFRSMCSQMQKKFKSFTYDDLQKLQKKFVSDEMHRLALKAIKRLSQTPGHYVAVHAKFAISSDQADCCILDFDHPVNKHLSANDIKVHLQIICNNAFLTATGQTIFAMRNPVKITSIGKVATWDSERRVLVINPIAIYF